MQHMIIGPIDDAIGNEKIIFWTVEKLSMPNGRTCRFLIGTSFETFSI